MEHFAKIVNGFQPLTMFAKSSILNIWLSFEYTTAHGDDVINVFQFIRQISLMATSCPNLIITVLLNLKISNLSNYYVNTSQKQPKLLLESTLLATLLN